MSPLSVSDSLSNTNEQIEQAAKAIGQSESNRKVFDAIYTGKRATKTVADLAQATSLSRKQILTSGKKLASRHVVDQTKREHDTAYTKIPFFYTHKTAILKFAKNPKKLAKLPTKRKVTVTIEHVVLPTKGADVEQISIDDIDSFQSVTRVADTGVLPNSISEKVFKEGVQRIVAEPGKFTDWGGEKNDLYTTRIRIRSKRRATAIAFKGPGTKGPLVPGKMGKNGDQIQRLFQSTAEVFLLQFWSTIAESVLDQMRPLAVAKSLADGKKVFFGVIDGSDSHRLYRAYPRAFVGR